MAKAKKAANAVIDFVTPKKASGALPSVQTTRMGDVGFDPRFDDRIKEQQRLNDLTTTVEKRASQEIPSIYLPDYEGYGYVSSMADRTAGGGSLIGINDVSLKRPVGLQAGQSYMFENPGQVWASGDVPVRAIMMQAAAAKALTGKDPLYLPHRLAPTGSDFATMTGETMLSFAESNMGRDAKKTLNSKIKEFIPDWKGVDSPKSIDQFRSQPDVVRKAIHTMMDRDFRNEGGLGIGEARLSIADPEQLSAPVGYLMNVGKIFADKPLLQKSGHASYPRGVPGEGIGRINDERSLFELYPKTFPEEGKEKIIRPLLLDPKTALSEYNKLPDVVEARNIADPKVPSFDDTRALQMKPYYGILTEDILRGMGYAAGGLVDSAPEEAIKNTIKDPQAFKMLDMDLANLALMSQQMQTPRRMAEGGSFNPQGADYDYQTARAYGMGQDGGNWGSVAPASEGERKLHGLPEDSYLMLKGAQHPTWGKAVEAETARGSKIVKHGDRYYSVPNKAGGGAVRMAQGGQVQRFDGGGQASLDQMRYELTNSPVMQATPRSPIQNALGTFQNALGTFGGYMDRAGKFVSEAIAPTAEKHPVKHFLANMLLADSLKGAGTLMQDMTGTVRETDEDNPVRGVISKDWKKLTTSKEPLLDPRALDLAGFVTPVVKGATKLGQAGVKAITPFAKSTAEMAAEMYGSGKMPFTVAPNAYMAEPSAPKIEKILAPATEQGFYSPTEAAGLNLKRQSGNGQAFLNDILKGENVRAEEVNAMGLDTFLKDKKNITAAEVQDYIAQNKLGLSEQVYKDKPNFITFLKQKGLSPEDAETMYYKAENRDPVADNYLNEYLNIKTPKFQGYSLPGGENYREVVLTLPLENSAALEAAQIKAGDLRRQTADLSVQYRNQKEIDPQSPRVLEAWQKLEESRNLRDQAEAEADALRTTASNKTYRSSHFDEPNVLAHLRMSDRVTDGKKTLLVDEVQSDWHQAGREQGYKLPPEATAPMDSEYRSLVHKNADAVAQGLTPDPKDVARAKMLEEQLMQSDSSKVPNAPYKDDWYQLALRRAVKEAIDGGYDRVALPTGARVNERFSLTKQINEIHYSGSNLKAYDHNGKEVISTTGVRPEDLPSYVGKETANKLLEQPKQGTLRSLVGQDLEVGGEGNKKYYDEIYPGYLKNFGKKYGASVGTTYAKTDIQEWPFPIQIESDGKNFWLFGQDPRIDKKAKLSSNFSSYEDANKFRDSMYEGNTEPLHYMDITPAMRKEFSTGIHMAKGGKVSFASNVDAMRHELTKAK